MSVQELHKETVNFLLTNGLLTPSAHRKIEIFVEVKNLQHQGIKKTHAVQIISDKCKMCVSDVWEAMKMEKS
jgi:hypothetical protein